MNKELRDITITVYATQDTVESDSFNNTYDENATYPVANVTELKEALTNGGIDTGVNGGYGINVRKGAAVTINDGYYYGDGTAVQVQEGTLVINGGTFVNFDPSNNSAEGAGTNFVADGYKVVPQAQTNGDIWYTVVVE